MKRSKKIKDNFYKKETGKIGEEKAANFLQKNGYTILERNFVSKLGEIDIIAREDNEYIFIEVKTRSSKKYGIPVEAVNRDKIKHIINVSKFYILQNNLQNKFIRYDIIEVYINKNDYLINHIKNVFF